MFKYISFAKLLQTSCKSFDATLSLSLQISCENALQCVALHSIARQFAKVRSSSKLSLQISGKNALRWVALHSNAQCTLLCSAHTLQNYIVLQRICKSAIFLQRVQGGVFTKEADQKERRAVDLFDSLKFYAKLPPEEILIWFELKAMLVCIHKRAKAITHQWKAWYTLEKCIKNYTLEKCIWIHSSLWL